MSNKFKYAPGLPGFGSKGNDGSAGTQGLAMYFTDLDPVTATSSIESRIRTNFSLWSVGSVALPDGRSYVTGDIFFDSEGKAYEIDAENGTFAYKFASLNMGGYFVELGVTSDDGYLRYFNSNTSPKYIIDNVFSTGEGIDYSQVPTNIYSIDPQNFARIEFSEVVAGNYNPFTLYSSGLTAGTDDDKAIAIVREIATNTFRIGNLDNAGTLRDVDLIFDVSSLRQKKETGNSFSENTTDGAILTNHEINANVLFDDNFNSAPGSFSGVFGTVGDCSIKWKLEDFVRSTDTTGLVGTLYFFTNKNPYNSLQFGFDSSAMRPLIFHNVDASGAIKITGLKVGNIYSYYMQLSKNGWIRNSIPQNLFGGTLSISPTSISDVSWGWTAWDASVGFNITSNVPWSYQLNHTFLYNAVCTSLGGSPSWDGSLYIDVSMNTGADRSGTITFIPQGATNVTGTIYQDGPVPTVNVSSLIGTPSETFGTGSTYYWKDKKNTDIINVASNLPATTQLDISVNFGYTINNFSQTAGTIDWKVYARIVKVPSNTTIATLSRSHTGWTAVSGTTESSSNVYIGASGIVEADFPLRIDTSVYVRADNGAIGYNYLAGEIEYAKPTIRWTGLGDAAEIDNSTAANSVSISINWYKV